MRVPPRPGLRDSSAGEGESINLTPMLDVLFILLFFFFFATQAKNETPALEIELPKTSDPRAVSETLPGSVARISITKENAIWLDKEQVAAEELAERLSRLDRTVVRQALVRVDRGSNSPALLEVLKACSEAQMEAIVEYEKAASGATPQGPRP